MRGRIRGLLRRIPERNPPPARTEPPLAIPFQPFEVLLKEGHTSLLDLVQANMMRSSFLTSEPTRRAVGTHYYPLLLAAFLDKNPGAQVIIQDGAGLAACLAAGDDAELELLILRNTLRYDWTEPRLLEGELNQIDDDAGRWLRTAERRSLQLVLFDLATQVQTAIGRENKQHPLNEAQGAPPTPHLATDLAVIAPQVAKARERLEEDAPRSAQVVYAQGMAIGALGLGVLCGAIAAVFHWEHIAAVNGVAFLAGGIAACLSVFQRMTTGKLVLDYKVGAKMLTVFGGVRPFVGGAFGMVTFCAIRSGLLTGTLIIPSGAGAQLAFFAFFGFSAGFSERFVQDMLRTASPVLGAGDTG